MNILLEICSNPINLAIIVGGIIVLKVVKTALKYVILICLVIALFLNIGVVLNFIGL